MSFRCIGPTRGGRCVAVAGHPVDRATFYFGAVAGGVWKTEDAGTTGGTVSDGFFRTSSVGALAVSDSDPNVIYAGMGESCIRLDVSHGDGVYRSTDGGRTWTHCGLADTRHIGKIRIHPKNPDRGLCRRPGPCLWPQRVSAVCSRSTDGGQDWNKVLYKSDQAGAVDLSFDPKNPRSALCHHLAGLSQLLGDVERRSRQRPLEVDRRRRHLDRHHPEPGAARRVASSARSASPPRRQRRGGCGP